MKKSILKTLPSVLLLVAAFIAFGGCKKKDEKSHIEITNVDATILQDCIDYPEIKDTFSIVLDKYPEGILSEGYTESIPSEPIKSDFRQSRLKVVVSGRIYKELEYNSYLPPPNAKYSAPKAGNKFIITKISKK